MADPLHGHLRRIHLSAEGQVRQDADLPAGVDAIHIGRGVRLGVAAGLGLPQGVGEKGAAAGPCG